MQFTVSIVCVVIGVIVPMLPASVLAEQKPDQVTWRMAVKSQVEWWVLRREVWSDSYYFGWGSDPIVETFRPQPHLMIRPEFSVAYRRFSFRAYGSISAETSLKEKIVGYPEDPPTVGRTGTGRWSSAGTEVGYGGAVMSGYLGAKYWKVDITDWPDDSLFSHSATNLIVGMRLQRAEYFGCNGFAVDMNMYMGVNLLLHIFDQEETVQHPQMAGGSLDFGWHPRGTPWTFTLGYGIDAFMKYIGRGAEPDHWQNMLNYAHGASVTISWSQ